MSDRPVIKSALAVALGIAGLLGVGFFGYGLGVDAGQDGTEAAVAAARQEVRKEFEGEEYRQEVIAQLLAIVRSPPVEQQLSEEAREVVQEATDEIGAGNLQGAAELLPGVLASISRMCVPEDQSVAVAQGTPVETCHVFGTKALVGPILNAGQEVRVTIEGQPKNVLFGTAFDSSGANCDLLVERKDELDGATVIWVSFAC